MTTTYRLLITSLHVLNIFPHFATVRTLASASRLFSCGICCDRLGYEVHSPSSWNYLLGVLCEGGWSIILMMILSFANLQHVCVCVCFARCASCCSSVARGNCACRSGSLPCQTVKRRRSSGKWPPWCCHDNHAPATSFTGKTWRSFTRGAPSLPPCVAFWTLSFCSLWPTVAPLAAAKTAFFATYFTACV